MATTVKIKDYDGVQRSYAVNKGIRLANADGTGFETFTQDGGGSNAALLGVLDGTVTQLTAQDLAGLTELAPYSLQHLQNLYSLELPSGFLTVGESACDSIATLSTVIFPASLTTVDSGAFMYTSIASVVLGDSVTNISHYAFASCSLLQSVTIGSGLSSLAKTAFWYCGNMEAFAIDAVTPPTITGDTVDMLFEGCTSLTAIYVQSASVNAYKTAYGWSDYASIIQAKP